MGRVLLLFLLLIRLRAGCTSVLRLLVVWCRFVWVGRLGVLSVRAILVGRLGGRGVARLGRRFVDGSLQILWTVRVLCRLVWSGLKTVHDSLGPICVIRGLLRLRRFLRCSHLMLPYLRRSFVVLLRVGGLRQCAIRCVVRSSVFW